MKHPRASVPWFDHLIEVNRIGNGLPNVKVSEQMSVVMRVEASEMFVMPCKYGILDPIRKYNTDHYDLEFGGHSVVVDKSMKGCRLRAEHGKEWYEFSL